MKYELWECQFTFFTVNYTMTCLFSLPRTVTLMVFYCKMTCTIRSITVINRTLKKNGVGFT